MATQWDRKKDLLGSKEGMNGVDLPGLLKVDRSTFVQLYYLLKKKSLKNLYFIMHT